jgi:hypothetical protein
MTLLKLLDGRDSTFESYLQIAQTLGPENNQAVRFINDKIKESPQGGLTEVLVEEPVMMWFLKLLVESAK